LIAYIYSWDVFFEVDILKQRSEHPSKNKYKS
jgi:hypothetical protein